MCYAAVPLALQLLGIIPIALMVEIEIAVKILTSDFNNQVLVLVHLSAYMLALYYCSIVLMDLGHTSLTT
jgi:hypothetical protein